jgi:hypothetical protein
LGLGESFSCLTMPRQATGDSRSSQLPLTPIASRSFASKPSLSFVAVTNASLPTPVEFSCIHRGRQQCPPSTSHGENGATPSAIPQSIPYGHRSSSLEQAFQGQDHHSKAQNRAILELFRPEFNHFPWSDPGLGLRNTPSAPMSREISWTPDTLVTDE